MALPAATTFTVYATSSTEDDLIAHGLDPSIVSLGVVDVGGAKKFALSKQFAEMLGREIMYRKGSMKQWFDDIATEAVDGLLADPMVDQYEITLSVVKL